ncbi:MAG: formyltetrahydrofolate deformylase [Porticoccus sp.]
MRKGKDVEKNVLAKGLRYHLEDRVLLHGNKTIVFE